MKKIFYLLTLAGIAMVSSCNPTLWEAAIHGAAAGAVEGAVYSTLYPATYGGYIGADGVYHAPDGGIYSPVNPTIAPNRRYYGGTCQRPPASAGVIVIGGVYYYPVRNYPGYYYRDYNGHLYYYRYSNGRMYGCQNPALIRGWRY